MRLTTPRNEAPRYDFFISYTKSDADWANWIAEQLPLVTNAAGQPCIALHQEADFVPGTNWAALIHQGLRRADRLLLVLSPDYLERSRFGAAEWQAAWVSDPNGNERHLVPVRVRECQPRGLLGPIEYIDLVGLRKDAAGPVLLRDLDAAIHGRRRCGPTPFPGPA